MSAPTTNRLLDALSPALREQILDRAEHVSFSRQDPLQAQEERPHNVYFLTSGVASVVVRLYEGPSSEALLMGRETVAGAMALLGGLRPTAECFMQVAGEGYQVPLPELRRLFLESEELRRVILETAQYQTMLTMQVAACNLAHDAEARLARWLLMIRDRVQADSFHLTQEFLAQVLGARRTTVALAAGSLQRSGFITYSRGKVTILLPEELETASCECYAVTQRLLDSLHR